MREKITGTKISLLPTQHPPHHSMKQKDTEKIQKVKQLISGVNHISRDNPSKFAPLLEWESSGAPFSLSTWPTVPQ